MIDGQKGSLTNVPRADIDSVKNQAHSDGESSEDEKLKKKFKDGLNDFSQSLLEVLNDITALEVNTMIVENITGTKFIAEEAYQNIYFCLNRYSNIVRNDDLRKYLKDEIDQLHQLDNLKSFEGKDIRIPPQFTSLDDTDTNKINITPEVANGYKRLREKLVREYIQIFFGKIYGEEDSGLKQNKLPTNLPFPYDIDLRGWQALQKPYHV